MSNFIPVHKPTFVERVQRNLDLLHWKYLLWCGYYTKLGEPLRCTKCDRWHWKDKHETIKDSLDYTPCEVETRCTCGHVIGYWAYGYWQPLFM